MAEIVALIGNAIEGVKLCISLYNAIKDMNELPAAFHEVSKQLPLVQSTLEGAKQAAQDVAVPANADPRNQSFDDQKAMLTTITKCEKKVMELKEIFRKARDTYEDDQGRSFRKAYHAVVDKLGGIKHRVEDVMRDILNEILSLGANQVFRLATSSQIKEIKQALDALEGVEPSMEESKQAGGNSFTHWGSGDITGHLGQGDMFTVKGGTVNRFDQMVGGLPKSS
ncbi:hypothetical protein Daus18300_009186 [Diaporthe australafricana]|uniref:NACHT-NTPase and P-loop NTPases N-terminal domain-containing protein n=1 Tax=Diaporthe australafricana TaxID=127596 RepID=A0ABR3WFC4_9PEZI